MISLQTTFFHMALKNSPQNKKQKVNKGEKKGHEKETLLHEIERERKRERESVRLA